jgi:myo-inositol 2-dehydrogenase / D-chiro-inositol 1-dehydrogenase
MNNEIVRVGIIGSGFISDVYARAFRYVPDAQLIAVASPTPGNAQQFATRYGVPNAFEHYQGVLARKDIDMVVVGIPNDLHAEITIAAAQAGKHIVMDKPLSITLEEADTMIEACQRANVLLMYGENLVFTPKMNQAKALMDEGALGKVFLVKHAAGHFGPHSRWFWEAKRSGGGSLLDIGCHLIESTRWLLGKPVVKSITASMGTYAHRERTTCDDQAFCLIEYEGNRIVQIESTWARQGGGGDLFEVYGDQGVTRGEARDNSLLTYSAIGYGYAGEKVTSTQGYTFTAVEEIWNNGIPREMQHFVRCVKGLEKPIETGEDGREVLKIIYAAYQSAGEGRRIEWPYAPPTVAKPIDLWKPQ